mmetsp:Transcript_37737/g.123434  ORF Transcript_37737/g.123434 Transcript_37737/m.123434 type:complete len:196 (-) Transcript_37737:297-884(-)
MPRPTSRRASLGEATPDASEMESIPSSCTPSAAASSASDSEATSSTAHPPRRAAVRRAGASAGPQPRRVSADFSDAFDDISQDSMRKQEEAAAEAARQGLAPCWEEGEGGSRLGDTWWLFNGVAGRLTLEPLLHTAGPTSLVFMGRNLKQRMPKIEAALRLPAGTVTNVYATAPPVLFGERLITCGVAKGLAAPE